MQYVIRPLVTNETTLEKYHRLFQAVFPRARRLDSRYLRWLYAENPDGQAVGFDAWMGEELVAHYVCIPVRAIVNGEPQDGLLSLNSATSPGHQRQGLFAQLAKRTYTASQASGKTFVYGVANHRSTIPLTRDLGFTLVGPLDVRIGIGQPKFRGPDTGAAFSRHWSPASMAWRLNCPTLPCRITDGIVSAPAYRSWENALRVVAPSPEESRTNNARTPAQSGALPFAAAWASIGFRDGPNSCIGGFVLPRLLMPRPLNVIYRPLRPGLVIPSPSSMALTFLDFDAF